MATEDCSVDASAAGSMILPPSGVSVTTSSASSFMSGLPLWSRPAPTFPTKRAKVGGHESRESKIGKWLWVSFSGLPVEEETRRNIRIVVNLLNRPRMIRLMLTFCGKVTW
ncbi:hypothetical protein PHLCEN_2v3924 [Hermanssonia centrifuga]|uniref:Uncharacterized protein n=1 Tax=Hermanssonia centrifuga TaxID=98765 RepID=A0A2R6QB36_9APHY|nr:hypothetical protein PHLCEN_2v3924 [Hermanssonia centrifuga]